jgi:hypothetical protein
MLEPLCHLLAPFFEALLSIAEPLISFFLGILSLDESLTQSSRLGEAPIAREGRRFWRNCGLGCLGLIVLVFVAAALVGLWQG